MKKALLTYISTTIFACSHYPTNIEKTLSFAGSNRNELEKVLHHYAKNPEDSLKYKAACFLIDNMKWHLSTDHVSFPDSSIFEWHSRINNLYDNVTDNIADTSLYKPNINELLWNFTLSARYLYSAIPSDTPYVQKGIFPDPKNITADFLMSHIDNAFHVWQSSSHASYLSFDEFKELILPYRAVTGYSFYENGKKLNDMFGKWLDRCTDKNLDNYITRYQHYAGFIQMTLGFTPQKQHVGIYDLFLGYKGDCISVADNACKVFRAYGIPVAVDCNISYRERAGRHFHCTLFDTTGNRVFYNATGNYDTLSLLDFASPSIIRNTFGAQSDSPYKLKATDEYLPKYFDTPCIKDVTSEYYPVTQIALPFNMETSNRLAYLYSYSNQPDGRAPTTWGEINRENKQVIFKNAVYYVLYFPMCFQGDTLVPFGPPFYITPTDSLSGSYRVVQITSPLPKAKGTLLLHRKYPEKAYLRERARRMVGGRFEAANQKDFSDAVLLCTIRETPVLNIQEYTPAECRPFRYYRYVASDKHPESNMGILEFITDEYTPEDSLKTAIPVPILSPEEAKSKHKDERYMKLLPDLVAYPRIKHNQAFNTHVRASSYNKIDFLPLKRPMTVKKIRFSPANAENHIVVGHTYQLMYWDNGWKNAGTRYARYNFLQFDNVPLDCLYWLRDLTTGKEELPFFYRDGKQLFIYHDTIVTPASLIKNKK